MMSDSSLPIGGSTLIAGLLYAGASMFITGPLIGERMVDRSNWSTSCQRVIANAAERENPSQPRVTVPICQLTFGLLGRDGQAYWDRYGRGMNGAVNGPLSHIQEQRERVRREALERATENSESRCGCAAAAALEENRVAFALHAGSLRLVTPPAVKRLEATLQASLGSGYCRMEG